MAVAHRRPAGELKTEWVGRDHYRSQEEAKRSIYFYVEMFYNSKRRERPGFGSQEEGNSL
jgi:hypothetical protein